MVGVNSIYRLQFENCPIGRNYVHEVELMKILESHIYLHLCCGFFQAIDQNISIHGLVK